MQQPRSLHIHVSGMRFWTAETKGLMENEKGMSKDEDQEQQRGDISVYQANKGNRHTDSKKPEKKCFSCGKSSHYTRQCL